MFDQIRRLPKKRREKIQAVSIFIPFGATACLMLYGIVRWPMAPIREVAGRYIDKAGTAFTEGVYQQFQIWQIALAASFAISFGAVLIGSWILGLPVGRKRSGAAPGT